MKDNIIILNSKERKQIRKQLEEQFGITNIPDNIYFCVKERDNVYITNKDLFDIDRFELRTSSFGLHFGSYEEEGFLLSIEGSQLVGEQATKNVIEITDEQKETWLTGEGIEVNTEKFENKIILLKQKNNFFGAGRAKKGRIKSSLPKSRTIKNLFDEEE